MFQTFRNAWKIPELKNRLLFTLAILVVYRLGSAIPVPFITGSALNQMFSNGNMLSYLDMMSGGALSRCTLFALGVTPYINASIIVQLLTNLKVFLGFLLLIVPGIYWDYCYTLVPYLLAENPYMSATRAMELSKEMMEGEKWNYFVLQLSFFGWLLLCAFTFGIGGFFLEPYMQATYAEFYAAMRSKALAMGMTTTDELGGFVRHDTYPNDMDF